jgi:Domain of unknown function (DUF4337)
MPEELHEIHERAEKAREDSSLAPVTVTMAVMAVLVAAISVVGHRAHGRTLLLESRATDSWAQYQAKSIRAHNYEMFADLLSVAVLKNADQAAKLKQSYTQEAARYRNDQTQISGQARALEEGVEREESRAGRFDLGEVCLEAALVIVSVTLLTGRRHYWGAGCVLGLAGVIVALTGFLVH